MQQNKTAQENKTLKMTFLIRPSVAKAAKKIAHMQRESVTNVINLLLEGYVRDNQESLAEYEKLYGKDD